MKYQFGTICFRMFCVLALTAVAVTVNAQFLRTSYFIEGTQYRLQLNPALAPERGFVHLPGIGLANASIRSNSMSHSDVIEMIKNKAQSDYFTSDKFINSLKDMNNASITGGTDLLSVGWWQGEGFWTLSCGVKVDGYAVVPRDWFNFMRDRKQHKGVDFSDYTRQIGNEELNINAYTEIGVGYSRQLNDWLTVGGRVKGLLGMGNMNLTVREAVIKTRVEGLDPDFDWNNPDPEQLVNCRGEASFDMDAVFECSFEGLELHQNADGYIDDINFEANHMGVAGLGAAFDAGVAFQVTRSLTLSAAITDLGFINWAKNCSQYAHSNTSDMNFTTDDPTGMLYFADVTGEGKVLNLDMLRLELDNSVVKSRKTNLTSALALGGEYKLADDRLSLGVLYTNRFVKPDNESELTLSANYHPSSLVDLAVSYSPVMCDGKAFGVAVKLGPLFIGSDYVFFNKDNKCGNVLVGLSIPLGKRDTQDAN